MSNEPTIDQKGLTVSEGIKQEEIYADGASNNSKWFALNKRFSRTSFRSLRFVLASIVLVFVVIPLTYSGICLISKDTKDFSIVVTKTVTKPVLLTPANQHGETASEDRSNSDNGIQTVSDVEKTEDSASKGVWAYGLQLATLAGALGLSLWAVVTLCRDDE